MPTTRAEAPTMRDSRSKIISRSHARTLRTQMRSQGKRVVFTNGCYDLMHAGHVSGIEFARRQGDVLFLGVSSDVSVRANKGPDRPIIPDQERARLLASLEAVDYVILFDEKDVLPLIEEMTPDILVKGADRAGEVVGQDFVEQHGGEVRLAPLVKGRSTTDIIDKVLRTYRDA